MQQDAEKALLLEPLNMKVSFSLEAKVKYEKALA